MFDVFCAFANDIFNRKSIIEMMFHFMLITGAKPNTYLKQTLDSNRIMNIKNAHWLRSN